jgi:YHS domain-containing protein
MFRKLTTTTLLLGLFVTGSVLASPQSHAPGAPGTAKGGPALGGYCPVADLAMNEAMKGDPTQGSQYKGQTYLFANADAKKMFDAAPEKYLPAYAGWCATAVAQGMKLASDPKLFTVYNGRTYLFSTADARTMFDKDKAGTVAKADAAWPKVSQAS